MLQRVFKKYKCSWCTTMTLWTTTLSLMILAAVLMLPILVELFEQGWGLERSEDQKSSVVPHALLSSLCFFCYRYPVLSVVRVVLRDTYHTWVAKRTGRMWSKQVDMFKREIYIFVFFWFRGRTNSRKMKSLWTKSQQGGWHSDGQKLRLCVENEFRWKVWCEMIQESTRKNMSVYCAAYMQTCIHSFSSFVRWWSF